jgi:hypothetical protein
MEEIKIDIENHNTNSYTGDFDLLCVERIDHIDRITNCSLVTVRAGNDRMCIRIKFEWKEANTFDNSDFLYIPETNILFFRSQNQWGAIDLEHKSLKRHESAMWMPYIQRTDKYVLIEDDLRAESTKLNGEMIDSVPIDPPTESVEFDDRIEYQSPIFGRQILRTR